MDLYITWNESFDEHDVNGTKIDNIMSIDSTPDYFMRQFGGDYYRTQGIDQVENCRLCEFNQISPSCGSYCSSINVPVDTDKLYFLIMHESGGGGSYHEMRYIYVDTHKSTLLDIASDYFDCEDESNKDNMLTELEKTGSTCIPCYSAEDCLMRLYTIPLN